LKNNILQKRSQWQLQGFHLMIVMHVTGGQRRGGAGKADDGSHYANVLLKLMNRRMTGGEAVSDVDCLRVTPAYASERKKRTVFVATCAHGMIRFALRGRRAWQVIRIGLVRNNVEGEDAMKNTGKNQSAIDFVVGSFRQAANIGNRFL
jgi:hypothetical protein